MTNTNELWEWITGFEGSYQVSSLGRIRSYCSGEPALLALSNQARGKRIVRLYLNGRPTYHHVHRLVATHFLPAPIHGERYVCFKDRNSFNCKSTNLYWSRKAEVFSREAVCTKVFIPRQYIDVIRLKINNGADTQELARLYGCLRSTISRIVHHSIN